ncbi:MAG: restriction endonuclease subunit S [Bacteroidota bacterium]
MDLKKNLSQITEAQFGANTSASPVGELACVQGRDFNSDGIYVAPEPQYVDHSALRFTRILQDGDVLLSTKGRFFASVWKSQLKEAVATGTFIILKVKDPSVLPEFLAMFLNSTKAKKYYDFHSKTATVRHIGKKQLDYLEIEIPPIEKQRLLVKIHQLTLEEKQLTQQISTIRERIINAMF